MVRYARKQAQIPRLCDMRWRGEGSSAMSARMEAPHGRQSARASGFDGGLDGP